MYLFIIYKSIISIRYIYNNQYISIIHWKMQILSTRVIFLSPHVTYLRGLPQGWEKRQETFKSQINTQPMDSCQFRLFFSMFRDVSKVFYFTCHFLPLPPWACLPCKWGPALCLEYLVCDSQPWCSVWVQSKTKLIKNILSKVTVWLSFNTPNTLEGYFSQKEVLKQRGRIIKNKIKLKQSVY